jgi:hypothetical protein
MLRVSSPAQEGVMRVSKALKYQVLLDGIEMAELFQALAPFEIYVTCEPCTPDLMRIEPSDFLEKYAAYVKCLQEGTLPDQLSLRRYFSAIFTKSSDLLYAMDVGKGRYLVKALKPVIQLQAHELFASEIDGKIHPMVLGQASILWGIQFSYPQIYQNPESAAFSKVDRSPNFPNTELFSQLAHFLRQRSVPTPFVFQGKKRYEPIRLGKSCFSWINSHPQLLLRKVAVAT